MAMIRTLMLHRAVGSDRRRVTELFDRHEAFRTEMNAAQAEWRFVEYGIEAGLLEDEESE